MAFIGDGNNMANWLMIGCAKMGMDFSIGAPKGYNQISRLLPRAQKEAEANGCDRWIIQLYCRRSN